MAGERFTAEEPPPALNEVELGGANRDEGMLDPRMRREPVADGSTAVAGEIVRDELQIPMRKGMLQRLQQREVPGGVARGGRLRKDLSVAYAQVSIDTDLV